uniref:ribosomal protein L24 n=1 Tax=Pulvinaster venetus TaxID=427767 RepID=UPI001FCDB1F2|nr:ribosomal protein L24 [Pulvinaster venetus]UNJ16977.1 ribosomal protein L24 [Pulvinaster venetus]
MRLKSQFYKSKKISKYFSIGDMVKVISGKEYGKIGLIQKIYNSQGLVVIKGINLKKRHSKSRDNENPGQIVQFEAPISASNVMLYDEKNQLCTKIAYKKENNGKTVRVQTKNSEIITKTRT